MGGDHEMYRSRLGTKANSHLDAVMSPRVRFREVDAIIQLFTPFVVRPNFISYSEDMKKSKVRPDLILPA